MAAPPGRLAMLPLLLLPLALGALGVCGQKTGPELFPGTLPAGKSRAQVVEDVMGPGMMRWGAANCAAKANAMSVSGYTFYRANADLFYWDLNMSQSVGRASVFSAGHRAWLQGDMHVGNMGTFDDNAAQVLFNVNDFDQAYAANYLYDLYRLAASFVLVAVDNGFTLASDQKALVQTLAQNYASALASYAGNNNEDTFQLTKSNSNSVVNTLLGTATTGTSASRRKDLLDKYSVKVNGRRTFVASSDIALVNAATYSNISAAVSLYYTGTAGGSAPGLLSGDLRGLGGYFAVQDVARRLNAGLGSLGTPRFYVIVEGDTSDADDDRILDVKLQGTPSEAATVPFGSTPYATDAERVGRGNKALLYRADNHVGTMSFHAGAVVRPQCGVWYSVREVAPSKGSLDTTGLSYNNINNMAIQYGTVLAADHARSDGNGIGSFESAVSSTISTFGVTKFATEVANFAVQYASQVAADKVLFQQSFAAGRICVASQDPQCAV